MFLLCWDISSVHFWALCVKIACLKTKTTYQFLLIRYCHGFGKRSFQITFCVLPVNIYYSCCNWLSEPLWINKYLPAFLHLTSCEGWQQRDPAFGQHPEERWLGNSDPSLPRSWPHWPHQWTVQFAHSAQADGNGRHPEKDSRGPRIKGQLLSVSTTYKLIRPSTPPSIHHLPFCPSARSQWGLERILAVVLEALRIYVTISYLEVEEHSEGADLWQSIIIIRIKKSF